MTQTVIPLLYQIPLLAQLPPAPVPGQNITLLMLALITLSLAIMAITAIVQMIKQTNQQRQWSFEENRFGDIIWKSKIVTHKPKTHNNKNDIKTIPQKPMAMEMRNAGNAHGTSPQKNNAGQPQTVGVEQ